MSKALAKTVSPPAFEDDLLISYGIDEAVKRHYPELLPAIHAELGVVGAMCLKERTRPLTLILESGSGNGKTEAIQPFFPLQGSGAAQYLYRSDKFTPKAFVSHAATLERKQLRDADLLPKLDGKILLTKELAPLFRGREQEMQENFSVLISVLDGQGFTSDSGTHGQRGYEERILFNWIGATTPLPPSVHRMMSQLGTRLLFFEVPATTPDEAKLLKYALKNTGASAQTEVREKVNEFVDIFFYSNPVGSIDPNSIAFQEDQARQLVNCAKLLVAGRAVVNYQKVNSNWTPIAAMPPEGVWKVVGYLKELAFGHALVHGRDAVDASDIALVQHVAISSIPGHLRPLIRELIVNGRVDTKAAMALCRVTHPTARNYLGELALLGLARLHKGNAATNQPDSIVLADEYSWLQSKVRTRIRTRP